MVVVEKNQGYRHIFFLHLALSGRLSSDVYSGGIAAESASFSFFHILL
jgi:hypothetical protein